MAPIDGGFSTSCGPVPRPNPFAALLILDITGGKGTARWLRVHFCQIGAVNPQWWDPVRLPFTRQIVERVQDRYNSAF